MTSEARSISIDDALNLPSEEVAKRVGIPLELVSEMRRQLSAAIRTEPHRPESVDRGLKTQEDINYWKARTPEKKAEPLATSAEVSDVSEKLDCLLALFTLGLYCLVHPDRQWVKWGFSNDVTDPGKNDSRLKRHLRDGWILMATKRGVPQSEEKRIRTALKRMGYELFPCSNEIFRLDRQIIQEAIDLGAPLPDDPFSLLKPNQLEFDL